MAHIQLVKQTSSGLLLPATPESCDFLHQIKIGEWIHADFKRVRNYAFHKRFFKLLQLGFDYWTPSGGVITPRERELVSGFVEYGHNVSRDVVRGQIDWLAEQQLVTVENLRGFYVVTLTSRGQDVAEGRARVAGVKRPRPRA